MESKKCMGVEKLSDNRFLNLYHIDARSVSGRPFDYYFASRNQENEIKIKTKETRAEGIVIYPVWKEDKEKLVMIKQYRYPLDAYVYEFPAGLIDPGENKDKTAVREMKEETGLDFEVYHGGNESLRNPFFIGPGFTDESDAAVFGYASGEVSENDREDTESLEVVLVDKTEAKRILKEERVCLRAAFLLMQFLHFLSKVLENIYQIEDKPFVMKKPITDNHYEHAYRYQNYNSVPQIIGDWKKDTSKQENITEVFKNGWYATENGASITFETQGSELAIQYRKSVKHPAPVAEAVIDGKYKVRLDANFEQTWGDCLYIDTVLRHADDTKHTVTITLTEHCEDAVVPFYLASVISSY